MKNVSKADIPYLKMSKLLITDNLANTACEISL